jgi:hypothetical protein
VRKKTHAKGSSLVELLSGLIIVVPIVLFLIDAATIYLGSTFNSSLCRDAARQASSGPPNAVQTNSPFDRASAVVSKSCQQAGAVRIQALTKADVQESVNSVPQAPFGGAVDGTVTVTTTANIYPPFFLAKIIGKGNAVAVKNTQTFPFTWVMPSTYAVASGGSNIGGATGTQGGAGGGPTGPTSGNHGLPASDIAEAPPPPHVHSGDGSTGTTIGTPKQTPTSGSGTNSGNNSGPTMHAEGTGHSSAAHF